MAVDIFPINDVYELSDGVSVYAYGFAEPGGTANYHKQRWLLLSRERAKDAPPHRPLTLKQTQDPDWRTIASADGFKDKVRSKFDATNHYYVIANCDRKSNMSSLPRPMPTPEWLGNPQIIKQPDIGTAQLKAGSTVVGYVQTFFPDLLRSREYWVLFNGYSAGAEPVMRTIEKPEEFADIMDRKSWNSSATLVTCACSHFTSLPPLAEM